MDDDNIFISSMLVIFLVLACILVKVVYCLLDRGY